MSLPKETQGQEVASTMEALADQGMLNAENADLHWLYEQSVQNVEVEVKFIDRVFRKEFGRTASFIREDFCGTALLCSEWVKRRRSNTALGVDYDGSKTDVSSSINYSLQEYANDVVYHIQDLCDE